MLFVDGSSQGSIKKVTAGPQLGSELEQIAWRRSSYRETGSKSLSVDKGLEVVEEWLVSPSLVLIQEIARRLKREE